MSFWGAAPNREGLGGPILFSFRGAIPGREGLGGATLVLSGAGPKADPSREALGGATLATRIRWQNPRI